MYIFFIIIGGIIIYLSYAAIQGFKQKEENEEKIIEQGMSYDAEYSMELNHVCGLPLAENSKCIVHLCNNNIVIESSGNIFKLQDNKIIDMNIKTSKEVKNSISGAVGGAILLGPIGAFIGGSSTDFHRFFIIIYKNKEDKEQCISFDLKDDLKLYKEIYNYIEEFKNNITKKEEIEL